MTKPKKSKRGSAAQNAAASRRAVMAMREKYGPKVTLPKAPWEEDENEVTTKYPTLVRDARHM